MKTITKLFGALVVVGSFLVIAVPAQAAVLGVTQITAVQTFAEADNTFEHGWKWVFDVTIPDNEPVLQMKFADWVKGADIIPAATNIRISSDQSSNATGTSPIVIAAANTYSGEMNILPGTDLDVLHGGRQIQITVEARVPVGSAGGSYSTSYGIKTSPDTGLPVITLIGNASTTVEVGATYTEAGATAFDNIDGVLIPSLSGSVNTSIIGSYDLTYNVTDSSGNAAVPVVRTVEVVDTVAPTITAPADVTTEATGTTTVVALGSPTVSDVGDPSPAITNDAPAGGFPLGTTTVIWTATDASGNSATSSQAVVIVDTTAPVITVTGDNPQEVPVFDAYVEAGATVTDNYDVGLTPVITGIVDTDTIGSYTIHYNVTDSNGNSAVEKNRTVNVIPRPITVTADAKMKVYGEVDPAFTYSITSGSLHGTDTLSGDLTRDAGENVGTYSITQGTLAASSSYTLTFVPGVLTITKATATVTLSDLSYTYDDTLKSATATTDPLGLTTIVTYDGSSTLPKNAGTYAVVATIDDANYMGSTTGSLVIAQKLVTITLDTPLTKVYDGTTTAVPFLMVNGGESGDVITISRTANFADKHVGTGKAVSITNIVLTGDDGANYTANSTLDVIGDITPLAITVTAVADTKPYDATMTSGQAPLIALALAVGDTSNFIQTFDTPAVGTGKTLTPSGTVNDGNSGANYAVTFEGSHDGVITIASQTITFSDIPVGPVAGNTITAVATSSSGLPATFTGGNAGICSIDTSGLITLLGAGECTVTAEQVGDANYSPATSVSQTFTVSFVVSAAPLVAGKGDASPASYQID